MTEIAPEVVAAFDLDGTLTEGGSVFSWLKSVAGAGATYRAALRLSVPLAVGAFRSGRYADDAKERLFHRLLVGRDLETVRSASRAFVAQHLEHESRPLLIERLAWHREQGHVIVVVSASPQLYVEMFAQLLGADGALGTRLAVDPRGVLTGSYLGRNCRGAEKMRRLSEWIDGRSHDTAPVIYAYGNSRGDRRLLGGATHPFNVGKLGRLGSLRRYPRLKSATES